MLESCLLECQKVAKKSLKIQKVSKAATEISAYFNINVNLKLYFMFVTILYRTNIGPEKNA